MRSYNISVWAALAQESRYFGVTSTLLVQMPYSDSRAEPKPPCVRAWGDLGRLSESFDALKWWLSHRPESGEIIDDVNWLFKQKGNRAQNIPALVVIYTFDHREVLIKFILVRIPAIP